VDLFTHKGRSEVSALLSMVICRHLEGIETKLNAFQIWKLGGGEKWASRFLLGKSPRFETRSLLNHFSTDISRFDLLREVTKMQVIGVIFEVFTAVKI